MNATNARAKNTTTANAIHRARRHEGQKMNLEQLIQNYLRFSQIQGKTPATLKWYMRRLGHFARFLSVFGHSMMIKDLTQSDGEHYVMRLLEQDIKWAEHPNQKPTHAPLAKHTIHGHVRAIRALTNWAVHEGLLPEDPFANLPAPKLPKLLHEILTDEEISRILACADSLSARGLRMRTMLLVALDTAVRADELVSLKLEHVDLQRGTVKVFGKGQKERVIPVGQAAQRELSAYINFHRPQPDNPNITNVFLTEDALPLTYFALAATIRRIRNRTGIKKLHMHLLRHTSITLMIKRGLNAFAVQQFAGHSSIKTTENYVHLVQHLTASEYRSYSVVDGLDAIQSAGHRGPKQKRASTDVVTRAYTSTR